MWIFNSASWRRAGCGALLGACLSAAHAAPPAAPVVTTGADIKVLSFDWDPVPRSNYYELWFKSGAGADYVKFGEIPASRTRTSNNISAHLLRWNLARYQVRACNSSGCSSSPALAVGNLMQDGIGYLKSSHSAPGGRFGQELAISEDAKTLAVVAQFETDRATAYVYRWEQGRWVEKALLMPGDYTGGSSHVQVALDGTGTLLALRSGQIVDGREGVVFIYRNSGGAWQLEQTLTSDSPGEFDIFGENPKFTEEGTRLLVSSGDGGSDIYRHTSSGWSRYKRFKPVPGATLAVLSGDGQVLARCVNDASQGVILQIDRTEVPDQNLKIVPITAASARHRCTGIDIDYLGSTIAVGHAPSSLPAANWNPGVAVVRAGSSYRVTSALVPGAWHKTIGNRLSEFGYIVKLSRAGEFLAVSDQSDSGAGHDVLQPPLAPSNIATGAVYLFQKSGGYFPLRTVLKPHRVEKPDFYFGNALAFGKAGKALAIGHPSERSGAFGVDGDRDDESASYSGAVWFY
jgi:hypothetical protein